MNKSPINKPSKQAAHPLPRHPPLTLRQNPRLPPHLPQPTHDLAIAAHKPKQRIRDADVETKRPDQALRPAQIVSRNARIQVVDGLELEAAVQEIQPRRAVDVHGGAEHFLGERLVHAQVRRAHREVAERDLHVQRRRHHVAGEDEGHPPAAAGDAAVDDAVAEPGPEEDLAGNLEPAVPPGGARFRAQPEQQVFPA